MLARQATAKLQSLLGTTAKMVQPRQCSTIKLALYGESGAVPDLSMPTCDAVADGDVSR
jgi:hypothetical protein